MPARPNNSIAPRKNDIKLASPTAIRSAMASESMQRQLTAMITDPKRRDSMVSSMVGMVQQTPDLQKCEISTVYNAAIAGEALNLPYGFGYWYAVPRSNNKRGNELGFPKDEYKEATFQMGYKGFIQLAMNASVYKDIDVFDVKEGEQPRRPKRRYTIDDFLYLENRNELPTVGYFACFELLNGFKKGIYVTYKEIVAHAEEYSYFNYSIYKKLIAGEKVANAWKYSSNWYKDFDMMASKTVLKRLLSKWGILSVEMQAAIKSDQAVVDEKGSPVAYPDNPKSPENKDVVESVPQKEETPAGQKPKKDLSKMFKK